MEPNSPNKKLLVLDGAAHLILKPGSKHTTYNEMSGYYSPSVLGGQTSSLVKAASESNDQTPARALKRHRYSGSGESSINHFRNRFQASLTTRTGTSYEANRAVEIAGAKNARQPGLQRFSSSLTTSWDQDTGNMQINTGGNSQSFQTNTISNLAGPNKDRLSPEFRTPVRNRNSESLGRQSLTRGVNPRRPINTDSTRRSGRLLSAVIQSKTSGRKEKFHASQTLENETRIQAPDSQAVSPGAQATAQLKRPFDIFNGIAESNKNSGGVTKTLVATKGPEKPVPDATKKSVDGDTKDGCEATMTDGDYYIHTDDTAHHPSSDPSTILVGSAPTAYCFRQKHTPSSLFALINTETSKLRDAIIASASEIRTAIGGPAMGRQIIDVEEANRVWSALNSVASLLEGVPQLLENCGRGEVAKGCVCGRCSCLKGGNGERELENSRRGDYGLMTLPRRM